MKRISAVLTLALLTVSTIACEDKNIIEPGTLYSIVVTPTPQDVFARGTQQFTAVGKDTYGNDVSINPTWSAGAGGTISSSGVFTAGTTLGTFANTVTATVGGTKGNATVNVILGPLVTIALTPNPVSLAQGATQQFTAVGSDALGNIVTITPTYSVVAGGGTINAGTGLFTAGTTAGSFVNTVKATSGAISAVATVNVDPGALATLTMTPSPATLLIGATQQFIATGKDSNGNAVNITPTYSVVAGGGTIFPSSGVFTAGNTPGTFANTVQATVGSMSALATVIVTAGPLATITVAPATVTLAQGGAQQYTATGRDAAGNAVTVTPVWSVVNGGGSIGAAGLFTAGTTAGTFNGTVKATSGTISGTASVTVSPPAPVVATITVTPNPASVEKTATQQFTAVAKDSAGNVVTITPVWAVVNGGGTINSASGLFTAGSATGTFANTVQATSGTISGTATVAVTSAPGAATTLVVTPATTTLVSGGTQQYVATGRDSAGNAVTIAAPTWSVVNGGGTISSGGLFTAGATAGTFTGTVKAVSGTLSGTGTVVVTSTNPVNPIIDLGAAGPNGIMAGTAVTCVNLGTVNADVSISPGNTMTGFGPCVVTGTKHLNDASAVAAQLALTTAYNTLAGLPCPPANIISANLGGTTKPAGVYCSASGIGVSGTLTLDGGGDPNATFVFQAGSSLITAGDVVLINGAKASNVYWQVGSSATLGTGSQFQGNILALTSITLVDNAKLTGRALARNGAVTLGTGNVIILP
jgi:hypothetical protein